jgi:hypothetical protein
MDRITSFREPRRRYATLRVIGFLCTLIGSILLVIGGGLLVSGLYVLATGGGETAFPPSPVALIPGPQGTTIPWPLTVGFSLLWSLGILFSGLQLIALGAFFQLMIHLEENTRASAQLLDGFRSRLEASPEGTQRLLVS